MKSITTEYLFYYWDDKQALLPDGVEVFSYPMGDRTIRACDAYTASNAYVLFIRGAYVDWTIVTAWCDYVHSHTPSARRILVLPYLPSARGDKDVPCPARINAAYAARSGITDVVTCDPHSNVWLDAVSQLSPDISIHMLDTARIVTENVSSAQYRGVIAPDKGAVNRAGAVAELLEVPLYVASKEREPSTGRLSHYAFNSRLEAGAYLVVDDICDGGGTFSLLTQAVADDVQLDLWVTHGGFTKPHYSYQTRRQYHHVYTTDSLPSAVQAASADSAITTVGLFSYINSYLKEIL